MIRRQHFSAACVLITLGLVGLTSAETRQWAPLPATPDVVSADPNAHFDHPCKQHLRTAEARAAAAERVQRNDPARGLYLTVFEETDVLHYDLDLNINHSQRRIYGTNRMSIRSEVNGLQTFMFRLDDAFGITDALINDATPLSITRLSETTLVATLDRTYDAGEEFSITIEYNGRPPSNGFGSAVIYSNYAGTLSEPYFAYTWWPCKDGDLGDPGDNADRATMNMSIEAPDYMRCVGPGELVNVSAVTSSRDRYDWQTQYPIPTYLAFFATRNYDTLTLTYDYGAGTMPVEFNRNAGTGWSFDNAPQVVNMLAVFETVYGPYPYRDEKYGVYQFHFGGGMEHPTSSGQSSLDIPLSAHELAHQWWGDNVTCKDWGHIWLNEGFATYSEVLYEEFKDGDPNFLDANNRMQSVAYGGTPFRYDTSTASIIFSSTVYNRGAWVLHLLRWRMGDDLFFQTLQQYRALYENSAATTEDLAAVASQISGEDLTQFFDNWVYYNGTPWYEYGGVSVQIDGQWYVKFFAEQVQDSGLTYTMPLDVQVRMGDQDRPRYRLPNDALVEHYVLPTLLKPHLQFLWDYDNVVPNVVQDQEVSYLQGPPVVVKVSPTPGAVFDPNQPVTEVEATLSEAVAPTAGEFEVVRVDGQPLGVTPTLTWIPARQTANITFSAPLPGGDYEVRVHDSVQFAGMALDGEIAGGHLPGGIPTGDGQPGGDAVYRFTVNAPAPDPCPEDLDGNNAIDSSDLAVLLGEFGTTSGALPEDGDINGDGAVDSSDLALLLGVFGGNCP